MDRKERARQFMPFDALSGLREALEEKEKELKEEEIVKRRIKKHENSN